MPKFTKGTWIAVGALVEHASDSKEDICSCDPESIGQGKMRRSYAEQCANARLIAAAPYMHDLLRIAVARLGFEEPPPLLSAWLEEAQYLLASIE